MNEEGIRFTVAISTYNVEKYVERAVKSVVNQEFDNFEIIIVDDSSTDNTMEIVNKLKIKTYKNNAVQHRRTMALRLGGVTAFKCPLRTHTAPGLHSLPTCGQTGV